MRPKEHWMRSKIKSRFFTLKEWWHKLESVLRSCTCTLLITSSDMALSYANAGEFAWWGFDLIRMQENPAATQESSAWITAGMKNQAGIGEGIIQGCSSLPRASALGLAIEQCRLRRMPCMEPVRRQAPGWRRVLQPVTASVSMALSFAICQLRAGKIRLWLWKNCPAERGKNVDWGWRVFQGKRSRTEIFA